VDTATHERATRGFEPSSIHTDDTPIGAAERVIGELTELSIGAAKENARLVAELQMAALDALHESHVAALRWQTMWPAALTDPLRLTRGRSWRPSTPPSARSASWEPALGSSCTRSIDSRQ
jgi:hypothetical protein